MFTASRAPRVAIGTVTALLCAAAVQSAPPDPRAIALLRAVAARLAAASTLSFVVEESGAAQTAQGAPRARIEITLRRPDQAHVTYPGRDGRRWVACTGRTMTSYSPDERALVIDRAPPTLEACLNMALQTASVHVPFVDLILGSRNGDLATAVQRARYLGVQLVDGSQVETVSFARQDVTVELSVNAADQLPRAIRAVSARDRRPVREGVVFSGWQLDVAPTLYVGHGILGEEHLASTEPRPVGTSGLEVAPESPPFTLYPYVEDFWRTAASEQQPAAESTPSFSSSSSYPPDGYGYYSPDGYGYNSAGELLKSLPAGCAAPYPHGPAFYLCGNTWFVAVYGPEGVHYYKVISPP